MINKGKKDMMTEDIEYHVSEMIDSVMNHHGPTDIARAPAIMRKKLEDAIAGLEQQLEDWKNES